MNRLKLLILYGGPSEEHDVSIKSARELSNCLDMEKYSPTYVYIDRNGCWRLADAPAEVATDGVPVTPLTGHKSKGIMIWRNGRSECLCLDVAFPMLHGKYGEDGVVQGVLEVAGIPYVGCGIAASALCMDKALAYLVAAGAGVCVPRHRVLQAGDEITACGLSYPLFVKPARSGSSFGVSKVTEQAALSAAVRVAFQYDNKALLEEAVTGREIGCAVIGNGMRLSVGALDLVELSGGFFRIHQEENPEQGSENATFRVPAPIPESARDRIVNTAKTVYRALGCRGLARVDLFLTPEGRVVLNEVNTMPGFTVYSRYPRMMAGAGRALGEVVDCLITLALEENGDSMATIYSDKGVD